jgi:peptidoglycan L-alanyl-D-glutamate endopeptidase CwlK
MGYRLGTNSLKNREGIDGRLIVLDDLAIHLTPVDYGHDEFAGLRSAETQNMLCKKGNSKCDGYTNKSPHQSGRALDFYAYVNGAASYDPALMTLIANAYLRAALITGIKIEWGGWWRRDGEIYGWDLPHIQLVN